MRRQWEEWYRDDAVSAIRWCLTKNDPTIPMPEPGRVFIDAVTRADVPTEAAAIAAPAVESAPVFVYEDGQFRSFGAPPTRTEHREKIAQSVLGADVCVARPVPHKERRENPEAQAALAKEWEKLRKIDCWLEHKVREWGAVSAEARRTGKACHVGRIFAICVEKNAELPKGHPSRKFKGRVVFQGNNVRDHNWDIALFQELSSCPATLEAAKAADVYGVLKGHSLEQADAEQAYAQSLLGGGNPDLGAAARGGVAR